MLNYFQYQFNYSNDMATVSVQRTSEILRNNREICLRAKHLKRLVG